MRKKAPMADKLLLKFRGKDSAYGVRRETLRALAEELHVSETLAVHLAISRFAREVLPAYEADEGPLPSEYLSWLKATAKERSPKGAVLRKQSLFSDG
jgi:hypothetical protein